VTPKHIHTHPYRSASTLLITTLFHPLIVVVLLMSSSIQNLSTFDPFADTEGEELGGKSSNYIHIRIQQRNGRKTLTTIQGLNSELDFKKILKAFKKEFCCNGTIVDDPELGQVIQLQGDQRKNCSQFLIQEGIVDKSVVKIHGFYVVLYIFLANYLLGLLFRALNQWTYGRWLRYGLALSGRAALTMFASQRTVRRIK